MQKALTSISSEGETMQKQICALKREVDQLWESLESLNEKQIHAQRHQRQIDNKLARLKEQIAATTANERRIIYEITSARDETYLFQNRQVSVSI